LFCSKNLRRQEKQLPPPDLSALDRCRVSYPRSPSAHSNPRAIPACRCCSRSLVEIYRLKCLHRGSKPELVCAFFRSVSRSLSLALSRSLSRSLSRPRTHSLVLSLAPWLSPALWRALSRPLSCLPPCLPGFPPTGRARALCGVHRIHGGNDGSVTWLER
jgi:hypothetical protein